MTYSRPNFHTHTHTYTHTNTHPETFYWCILEYFPCLEKTWRQFPVWLRNQLIKTIFHEYQKKNHNLNTSFFSVCIRPFANKTGFNLIVFILISAESCLWKVNKSSFVNCKTRLYDWISLVIIFKDLRVRLMAKMLKDKPPVLFLILY